MIRILVSSWSIEHLARHLQRYYQWLIEISTGFYFTLKNLTPTFDTIDNTNDTFLEFQNRICRIYARWPQAHACLSGLFPSTILSSGIAELIVVRAPSESVCVPHLKWITQNKISDNVAKCDKSNQVWLKTRQIWKQLLRTITCSLF